MPTKASEFYSRPTLKFLKGKFKTNDTEKEPCKKYIKNAVKLAFFRENIFSPEKLSKILERESIHIILRKSGEGQLYGISYDDHKTRSVFNGSSLGKNLVQREFKEAVPLPFLHLKKNTKLYFSKFRELSTF